MRVASNFRGSKRVSVLNLMLAPLALHRCRTLPTSFFLAKCKSITGRIMPAPRDTERLCPKKYMNNIEVSLECLEAETQK